MAIVSRIGDYKILSVIHESKKAYICNGEDLKKKLSVILKITRDDFPNEKKIGIFRHEYQIAKSLEQIDGVIRFYQFIKDQNRYAIAMENLAGQPLDYYISEKYIDLELFFKLAFKLTAILGDIHKQQIIHKNLQPGSIIFNRESEELRIIDFSLASRMARESQDTLESLDHIGSFAYISPEQTGRMNRLIDYRSDYYSLGLTFYQMLTGELPFHSSDTLELIHWHIAGTAVPPHKIVSNIPVSLSLVIMKMLSKMAETRYQSITGLQWDLEQCYQIFRQNEVKTIFFPGSQDLSGRFQIPEKIYGRDRELDLLAKCFQNTLKGQKEIVFLKGEAGIGKSAIIKEFGRQIVDSRAFYVYGKFDEFNHIKPYPAIVQFITGLLRQLLTEQEERLDDWKSKILQSIGMMGQSLISLIPELELLLGSQNTVEALPTGKTREQFLHAFINLIKLFTTKQHPLVLQIDGFQWADATSLKLLTALLLDPEIKYLLLMGTYRDNALHEEHPFWEMLQELDERGIKWQEIRVENLSLHALAQLLEDIFLQALHPGIELVNHIHQKTGGNPFFIIQFLKTLYEKGYIYCLQKWHWDLDKIREEQITDNIAELMIAKLKSFPEQVLYILKSISCLGDRVEWLLLSLLTEKQEKELSRLLKPLFDTGILIKAGNYIFFTHNRLRETAYLLLEHENKILLHYKIGRLLLQHASRPLSADQLFSIVGHLNYALNLLTPGEKTELLELNLAAAEQAGNTLAFDTALTYLHICGQLLPEDNWQTAYTQSLQVHESLAEVEYRNNNYNNAEKYCDLILNQVPDTADRNPALLIKFNLLFAHDKIDDLKLLILNELRMLGLKIPLTPNPAFHLFPGLLRITGLLKKIRLKQQLERPLITDQRINLILKIIFHVVDFLFSYSFTLPVLLMIKALKLIFKHGNSEYLSNAFIFLAIRYCRIKQFKEAEKYMLLAEETAQKYNQPAILGIISWLRGLHILSYTASLRSSLESMLAGCAIIASNDYYEYSLSVLSSIHDFMFALGENIKTIDNFLKEYSSFFLRQENIIVENVMDLIRRFYKILNRKELTAFYFTGSLEGDNRFYLHLSQFNQHMLTSLFHIFKIFLYFFINEYSLVIEHYNKIIIQPNIMDNAAVLALLELIYALSLIQLRKKKLISSGVFGRIKRIQAALNRYQKLNQVNLQPLSLLIDAELAAFHGKTNEAITLYDNAIHAAENAGFTSVAAIASEYCGRFYNQSNHARMCAYYIHNACYYYEQWGIVPKLECLNREFPDKFIELQNRTNQTLIKSVAGASSTSLDYIDLLTIIKSSQMISGEIRMNKLVSSLINTISANVGAEKGILILKNDKAQLIVEIIFQIKEKKPKENILNLALEECRELSQAIVHFVANTTEHLILHNAVREGPFTNDPYILKNRPLSILCTPIMMLQELTGIIYLENNLTTHAFNTAHLEIIEILSVQAAVAIRNARLYMNILESEKKYRTMLESIEEGYFETDLKGVFKFVNNALCKITGYHYTELITLNYRHLMRRQTGRKIYLAYLNVYKSGKSLKKANFQLICKDGREIIIEVSIALLTERDGKPIGFRGICQDITEKMEAEQFKIAKEIAEAANKAKGEFISSMSHEIRTPMNSILGFAELLLDHVESPLAREYLSNILSSGRTLLSLMNDILNLSRIEAGRLEVQYAPVKLPSLISHIEQSFMHLISKKGLKFIVEKDPDLPEQVVLDEIKITQILSNLITNALKFTDAGFIRLYITQQFSDIEENKLDLLFFVQDTGAGIPEDQQERIFETFRQQYGQDYRKYGGAGLGLSITKKLAELMNGRITVESRVGKGSLFSVILKDVEMTVSKLPHTQPLRQQEFETDNEGIKFENSSVLIVDDLQENRILYECFLSETNIKIYKAANGLEAVEMMHSVQPDLILMDMRMPVLDGYEATRMIKTDEHYKTIPVIAVTAYALKEDEQKIKATGCDNILTKPLSKSSLIQMLKQYLPCRREPFIHNGIKHSSGISPLRGIEIKSAIMHEPVRNKGLLDSLENEISLCWKQVSDSFVLSEVENFVQSINKLAGDYKNKLLSDWYHELNRLLLALDIEHLTAKLEEFPDIVNQIKWPR